MGRFLFYCFRCRQMRLELIRGSNPRLNVVGRENECFNGYFNLEFILPLALVALHALFVRSLSKF